MTIFLDNFFRKLRILDTGTFNVILPDGTRHVFEGKNSGENATLKLHDNNVIRNLFFKGDIGFAEDYRAGKWETDDLIALIKVSLMNKAALERMINGSALLRLFYRISYLFRLNSLRGSKKNIHAHYDLGNDFYQLWLDPSMTYSSAIFNNNQETLEQAQYNKYDRIIDNLGRNSGRLLEIGCGWGGFAEQVQTKGDFAVKGITLSEEQYHYAQNRLGKNADIVIEDYRKQDGKFDNVVSIEMFEAVGERYWKIYFEKLASILNKGGRAVIQTITINEQDFENYRRGGDYIRTYIFPGGMLPNPSRFKQELEKAGLKLKETFPFAESYAKTLEQWLENFDKKYDEIKALGFDDGFIRLWRFYLAGCSAAFAVEKTNVMQAVIEKS